MFDHAKVHWMNGHYIRAMQRDELAARVVPFRDRAGWVSAADVARDPHHISELVGLLQEGPKSLAEAPGALEFFFREPDHSR